MKSGSHIQFLLMALACGVVIASPAPALVIAQPAETGLQTYTGRLDYPIGLHGGGRWLHSSTWIEWIVKQRSDGWWRYEYVFSHRAPETSHLILEVSPDFARDQIRNHNWDFEDDGPRWYGPHPSNPGVPGSIFGLKFEELRGRTTLIQFESLRNPVWGDFYAKGGPTSGAWNLGFLDPDPLDSAADGSIGNKILRPNGDQHPIPEPAGVFLMGAVLLGAAAVAGVRRRRS